MTSSPPPKLVSRRKKWKRNFGRIPDLKPKSTRTCSTSSSTLCNGEPKCLKRKRTFGRITNFQVNAVTRIPRRRSIHRVVVMDVNVHDSDTDSESEDSSSSMPFWARIASDEYEYYNVHHDGICCDEAMEMENDDALGSYLIASDQDDVSNGMESDALGNDLETERESSGDEQVKATAADATAIQEILARNVFGGRVRIFNTRQPYNRRRRYRKWATLGNETNPSKDGNKSMESKCNDPFTFLEHEEFT